jgi:hypothetical protein
LPDSNTVNAAFGRFLLTLNMRKPIFLLFLLSFCLCPAVAQTGRKQCVSIPESDWKLQDLTGKVKTTRTFKTWFSKNEKTGKMVEGKQEFEEEFHFNSKGNQVAWKNVNYLPTDPKDALTSVYTCNGKKITEIKLLKRNGSLINRTTYGYDNKGNTIEEAVFFPDGTLERREKYILDAKGNIIEEVSTQQSHPEHFIPKRYDVYITTRRTFKYDDRGNAIEEKHFYPDGSLFGTWVSTYDAADRLIRLFRTDKQNRPEELEIYTFDNAGHLLEQLHYSNFCHTKDGQMCEGSLHTEVGIFEYGTKTVFIYDMHNNWKKQIEYVIQEKNGEKTFELSTALYRRLTYY